MSRLTDRVRDYYDGALGAADLNDLLGELAEQVLDAPRPIKGAPVLVVAPGVPANGVAAAILEEEIDRVARLVAPAELERLCDQLAALLGALPPPEPDRLDVRPGVRHEPHDLAVERGGGLADDLADLALPAAPPADSQLERLDALSLDVAPSAALFSETLDEMGADDAPAPPAPPPAGPPLPPMSPARFEPPAARMKMSQRSQAAEGGRSSAMSRSATGATPSIPAQSSALVPAGEPSGAVSTLVDGVVPAAVWVYVLRAVWVLAHGGALAGGGGWLVAAIAFLGRWERLRHERPATAIGAAFGAVGCLVLWLLGLVR